MEPKFRNRVWAVTLVLYLVAAVFSVGFIHPDEHFQILEFANFKLGHTPQSALAWEYEVHLRPWLQPALTYILLKPMHVFGFLNPFEMATALRVFSGVLGWLSVVFTSLLIPHFLSDKKWQKFALLALCLFYLQPILHVRTSSENYSTAAFVFGLYALLAPLRNREALNLQKEDVPLKNIFWAAVFFGLSFQFRYQLALMVVGVLLWCLWHVRVRVRSVAVFSAGFALVTLACTALDAWGYGVWTFAPFNYVSENLFHGRAAAFGVSPFYGYITLLFNVIYFPFNVLIFVGCVAAVVLCRRSVLIWASLPYVLVHCLIGHKEFRFLFPVLHFAPVFVVMALFEWQKKRNWNFQDPWLKVTLSFVAVVNAGFLFARSFRAPTPKLKVAQAIYNLVPNGGRLVWSGENPFSAARLSMHFYMPPNFETFELAAGKHVSEVQRPFVFYSREGVVEAPCLDSGAFIPNGKVSTCGF